MVNWTKCAPIQTWNCRCQLRRHPIRPWWWRINPWLYALRRDRAYEQALDIIQEDGRLLISELRETRRALHQPQDSAKRRLV